jgi:hypothetical protein
MALFSRREPQAQLPAVREPPVEPQRVLDPGELEAAVRARVWPKISAQLAADANMSLDELLSALHGGAFSTPQVEALARALDIQGAPPMTGVDVIRATLGRRLKRRGSFAAFINFPRGSAGEADLIAFAGGESCLTIEEMNLVAKAFFGVHAELDPATLMLTKGGPEPTSIGSGPPPCVPDPRYVQRPRTEPFPGTKCYPPPMLPRVEGASEPRAAPGWAT